MVPLINAPGHAGKVRNITWMQQQKQKYDVQNK